MFAQLRVKRSPVDAGLISIPNPGRIRVRGLLRRNGLVFCWKSVLSCRGVGSEASGSSVISPLSEDDFALRTGFLVRHSSLLLEDDLALRGSGLLSRSDLLDEDLSLFGVFLIPSLDFSLFGAFLVLSPLLEEDDFSLFGLFFVTSPLLLEEDFSLFGVFLWPSPLLLEDDLSLFGVFLKDSLLLMLEDNLSFFGDFLKDSLLLLEVSFFLPWGDLLSILLEDVLVRSVLLDADLSPLGVFLISSPLPEYDAFNLRRGDFLLSSLPG